MFGVQGTGGPGGGSVNSVTGIVPGIVDNTDPANPIVLAQFGPDTIVQLLNSTPAAVNALRLLLSLTVSTPGAEYSEWLIRVLNAGVATQALRLTGVQVLSPNGSQAQPAFAPSANPGTGIWFDGAGVPFAGYLGNAVFAWATALFQLQSNAGKYAIGTDALSRWGRFSANGGVQLLPGNSDVVLGLATGGGLAAGATAGFVDFPSIAAGGIPTAAPTEVVGPTAPMVMGAFGPWAFISGTNRWTAVARSGKGADVASAATLVIAPGDRTQFDYFHLTGAVACDFLGYTAGDVYWEIHDGQEVVFYAVAGTTINHNTAAPPAGTLPFKCVGAVAAVLNAGEKICFRRDSALGLWVEMYRTLA